MADHDRAEFYRERAPWAHPLSLVGFIATAALWAAPLWHGPAPLQICALYLAMAGFCWAMLSHYSYRRGWRVDGVGLHQVFRDGHELHALWPTIERLRTDWAGCTIYVRHGTWRLGAEVGNWQELVRRIESETGLSGAARPDVDQMVEPQQIAAWLGIQRSQALVCRPVRPLRLLWPAALFGLCLLAMGAGWDLMGADSLLAPVVIGLACAAPVSLWCYYRAGVGPRIRAHPIGLALFRGLRRHDLSWGDILNVRQVPVRSQDRYYATVEAWQADWDCVVDTTIGEFRFHRSLTNSERLVDTMRRVLAAKAQGRLLPDAEGLSAASISLAVAGGVVGEERGLSRSAAAPDASGAADA